MFISLFVGMNDRPQKTIDPKDGHARGVRPGGQGDGRAPSPRRRAEQVLDSEQEAQGRRPAVQGGGDRRDAAPARDTKGVDNVVDPYKGRPGLGRRAFGARELRAARATRRRRNVSRRGLAGLAWPRPPRPTPSFGSSRWATRSLNEALLEASNEEMGKSTMLSLPLTLVILVFAFGASAGGWDSDAARPHERGRHDGAAGPGQPARSRRRIGHARSAADRHGRGVDYSLVLPEAGPRGARGRT